MRTAPPAPWGALSASDPSGSARQDRLGPCLPGRQRSAKHAARTGAQGLPQLRTPTPNSTQLRSQSGPRGQSSALMPPQGRGHSLSAPVPIVAQEPSPGDTWRALSAAPPVGASPTSPWGWGVRQHEYRGLGRPVPGFVSEGAGSGRKAAHWPEMMVGSVRGINCLPRSLTRHLEQPAGQQALQRG